MPLWDSEGKPDGAIAAFVDITHQKTVEADLKKQMENLAMMNIIDSIITTSFNSDFTLTNILTQLSEKELVEAACIFMMDEEKPVLKYICGQGFRNPIPGHLQINLGQGIIGKVIENGDMIVTTIDDENNPAFMPTLILGEGFTRCYNIPLVVKKQVKGVMQIYQRSESPYDTDRIEFFDSVAKRVAIAIENSQLVVNLEQTNKDLRLAYDATIEGWSRAMDLRDEETEGHTERVTLMTVELARLAQFPEPELIHMRRGALLHDIGKLGVPDSILMKPGPLTEAEWVVMKRHPEYAFQMLSPIQYLRLATDIPYCHHERWDGSGYPRGLRGESIPLAARLFAVVDVWDALTSDRPYRPAWSGDRAIEYIRMNAGIHFDPNAVSLFLQLDKNAPQN